MIAQFIVDNGLNRFGSIEKLRECIVKHLEYGTLTTLYDDKGLYAVARYNLEPDDVAYVIDVVIREDRRSPETLKELIRESVRYHPTYKYLKFERGLKNKPFKIIPINKFLKGK
jgi:hypothetical protein